MLADLCSLSAHSLNFSTDLFALNFVGSKFCGKFVIRRKFYMPG